MTRPGGVARADRLVDLATRSATVCQRRRTLPSCSAWRSSIDRPMADPDRRLSSAGGDGEAGIGTIDWLPADELAEVILRPLLAERPAGVARARVLVNGLGSTKYEELFVLYGSIRRRLADAGIELVDPEVGEFVTSLDMAGCSLTLCWLDDESERLLAAPALSPGFRMAGSIPPPSSRPGPSRAAEPRNRLRALLRERRCLCRRRAGWQVPGGNVRTDGPGSDRKAAWRNTASASSGVHRPPDRRVVVPSLMSGAAQRRGSTWILGP